MESERRTCPIDAQHGANETFAPKELEIFVTMKHKLRSYEYKYGNFEYQKLINHLCLRYYSLLFVD